MVGLAGHHAVDRVILLLCDIGDQLVEIIVVKDWIIADENPAHMIGDPGWRHGIKFGLYGRVCGRRDYAEFHAIPQRIGHICFPPKMLSRTIVKRRIVFNGRSK
jgi:hypothetical protein